MRNQVAAADAPASRAATINSANVDDWREIEARIAADEVDVLLISPERLNNPRLPGGRPALARGSGGPPWSSTRRTASRTGATTSGPTTGASRDVLAGLGDDVPVLAATATANQHVEADVATQIGTATRTFRGSVLDRPSLHLSVVQLPTSAEQLA